MEPSEADLPPLPPPNPELVQQQESVSITLAAWAIVTAEHEGDVAAIRRYDITQEELKAWRRAMFRSPKANQALIEAVVEIRQQVQASWTDQLAAAKLSAIGYINRAAQGADFDSKTIDAVTRALGTLVETETTARYMDAKIAQLTGQSNPKRRQARSADHQADEEGDGAE